MPSLDDFDNLPTVDTPIWPLPKALKILFSAIFSVILESVKTGTVEASIFDRKSSVSIKLSSIINVVSELFCRRFFIFNSNSFTEIF